MHYPDILHHGAEDGVTGSCHQLLLDARHSLLIECGLFQGAETSAEGKTGADRLAIEFPLDTVKALITTHVHIDHAGRIPYLLAAGFIRSKDENNGDAPTNCPNAPPSSTPRWPAVSPSFIRICNPSGVRRL